MEIPFERRAPIGFFDVEEEKNKPFEKPTSYQPPKRRADQETEDRKKDKAKTKKRKESGLPSFAEQKAIEEAENAPTKAKLLLPTPLLSGREIEQIAKSGADQVSMRTPLRTPMTSTPMIMPEEVKLSVIEGFRSLPKPKNDFEIVVPEIEKDEEIAAIFEEKEKGTNQEDQDLAIAQKLIEEEAELSPFTENDIYLEHKRRWDQITTILFDESGNIVDISKLSTAESKSLIQKNENVNDFAHQRI